MKIGKLWFLITQLEPEYFDLIDEASSSFLQEMMDAESFNNNGARSLCCRAILEEITNNLNEDIMSSALNFTMEFCLTNDYLCNGQTWNGITHLLSHHSDAMTSNDKKYLRALNNSYVGIYKIVSVEPNISITLKDMIEPNNKNLRVLDKNLSRSVKIDQYIATRLLQIEHKTKPPEYSLSNSLIFLPEKIAIQSINIIQMFTVAMDQPFFMATILKGEEQFEDNEHNRLLKKKMWAKEILEQWYLYHANIEDYHEFFDNEGNPWQPCSLEFEVIEHPKKISAIFHSLPNFIENKANSWVWIDSIGHKALNYTKNLKPTLHDSNKSPIYRGDIMRNELNKLSYLVLAELRLQKNKLIIYVNSLQRANIAQDFIIANCGNMLKNPVLTQKSHDSSNTTFH